MPDAALSRKAHAWSMMLSAAAAAVTCFRKPQQVVAVLICQGTKVKQRTFSIGGLVSIAGSMKVLAQMTWIPRNIWMHVLLATSFDCCSKLL